MGSDIKKQYLQIETLPVLSHTLLKFANYRQPHEIILVSPEKDIEFCKKNILKPINIEEKAYIVSGGEKRQDSVLNGIDLIKTMSNNHDKDIVLIHDGVRPFIDHNLIDSCIKGAVKFGACVPAIKIVDTIKRVSNNFVAQTLDRESVYQVQTPQAFLLRTIVEAMEHAKCQDFSGTDDASIVEFFGSKVTIVKGLKRNIKITTKEDLEFATTYLAS